ncbi:hypothetical protein GEMRC1_012929 [Eukaryota sp. GEM-RC1]
MSNTAFTDRTSLITKLLEVSENLRSASSQLCDMVNLLVGMEHAQDLESPLSTSKTESSSLTKSSSPTSSPVETRATTSTPASRPRRTPAATSDPVGRILNDDPTEIENLRICIYGLISSSKKGLTYNQLISTFRGRNSSTGLFDPSHFEAKPAIINFPQNHQGPIGFGMIQHFVNDQRSTKDMESCLLPVVNYLIEEGKVEEYFSRFTAFSVQRERIDAIKLHNYTTAPPNQPAGSEAIPRDELRRRTARAVEIILSHKPSTSVNALLEFLRGTQRKKKVISELELDPEQIVVLKNQLTKRACEELVQEILAERQQRANSGLSNLKMLSMIATQEPPMKASRNY